VVRVTLVHHPGAGDEQHSAKRAANVSIWDAWLACATATLIRPAVWASGWRSGGHAGTQTGVYRS
jgi:hypothetical protein